MGSWQLARFLIANVIAILSLATFARAEIAAERVPLEDGPPARMTICMIRLVLLKAA
jgi:hypothetical protein